MENGMGMEKQLLPEQEITRILVAAQEGMLVESDVKALRAHIGAQNERYTAAQRSLAEKEALARVKLLDGQQQGFEQAESCYHRELQLLRGVASAAQDAVQHMPELESRPMGVHSDELIAACYLRQQLKKLQAFDAAPKRNVLTDVNLADIELRVLALERQTTADNQRRKEAISDVLYWAKEIIQELEDDEKAEGVRALPHLYAALLSAKL